jgi:hypothetical protein
VNHYERLKVSQDAPAEVIRAAYRTLATKLHPDRQGADTGPDDEAHSQMAALNAAYEVLIDPKSRQDYDATLAPANPRLPEHAPEPVQVDKVVEPKPVDMTWLTPKPKDNALWPPSRRLMVLGGIAVAVLVLSTSGWFWQMQGQHQMEQALSDQYAQHPVEAPSEPAVAPPLPPQVAAADQRVATESSVPSSAGARRPTVAELSRMSDEELVKVLPTLDADPPVPAPVQTASNRSRNAPARHHPLDSAGGGLSLHIDTQLVDPLAPDAQPADKAAKTRK